MNSFKGIPIAVAGGTPAKRLLSGEKYTTHHGFSAIKNGIKGAVSAGISTEASGRALTRISTGKPRWTRAPMPGGARFEQMRALVDQHGLATVCKEARCPNIGECWNAGTATLMLLGEVCTRACRFCAVDTGNPRRVVDPHEPDKVAQTVATLGLRYVVLTSVNRDDLPDGGAAHIAATVRAVLQANPATAVEVLAPDFQGNTIDADLVLHSGIAVFAQNIETVQRLTHAVRDPRAGYMQTLALLRHAKSTASHVLTKTSLMLGLGETDAEICAAMDDMRAAGVDILTLGQYLRPTLHHLPVQRYVSPEEFDHLRALALGKGFSECVSGPLVRSSYRAERAMQRNNVGLAA